MTVLEEARCLVQPSSPRYDRYDARIRFLVRVLSFVRRHRILCGALACAFLASVFLFLSLIGSFFSEAHCQDFVYGEAPMCDAKAFLATAELEYANLQGTPQWQQSLPSSPGQYRIRATAKNVFGVTKYSNEMTFTLLPRELTVQLPAREIVYGQLDPAYLSENSKFIGLAVGDRVKHVQWDIQLQDGPSADVALVQLYIENAQGEDVTACYRIPEVKAHLTLQPRPITVTAESLTKIYDGVVFQPSDYRISSGSLSSGDVLELTFETPAADVGRYDLTPACTIRNQAGEDVSSYYQITVESGLLTVQPIQLSIQTGSAEKFYDATPLSNSQWTLTAGSILDGHSLDITFPVQITAAGTVKNRPDVFILDADNVDVTHNYELNITCGQLTVAPIVLYFQTDSATKTYDGTELVASGYRQTGGIPVFGHTVHAYTIGTQTMAGSTPNSIFVTVLAADGTNVTSDGYVMQVDYGTLTVNRRPITITSHSAEKLYDGTALICRDYSITSGSLAPWEGVYWTDFTGSQTEVGSSRNTFTVKISSGRLNGTDVTLNYDITYQYGTLTVKPNPDYVPPDTSPEDPSFPGAGSQLPDLNQDVLIGFPPKPDRNVYATVQSFNRSMGTQQVYFRRNSYGHYTGSGWTAANLYRSQPYSCLNFAGVALEESNQAALNYLEITLTKECPYLLPYYTNTNPTLGNGQDQNDCYFKNNTEIAYGLYWMQDPGYYTMAKLKSVRYAAEEAAYQDYVYSTYLDVPSSTREALLAWAASMGIYQNSPTLVTDIQFAVQTAAVYNLEAADYPEGVDVAVYFLTEAKEGICQHFATAATLLYRCFGIPARYTTGFLSTVIGGQTTNITGADAHAWVEIYCDGVGWVYVEVTGSMSDNSPVSLTVQVSGATKQYDGQPFREEQLQQFSILSGALLPGHRLELTFSDNSHAITPGTYQNTIRGYRILDENGRDVTSSYDRIQILSGQLEILKRSITIVSGSAVKVADGTPLTCDEYWLTQGSLAEGDHLLVELEGTISLPVTMPNTFRRVDIYRIDARGQRISVKDYYDVHLIVGSLTILPTEP